MKDEELLRYNRQIMLPEIDIDGQEKLLAAKVLIVGLGGLGCPVAIYLGAAGVGHLTLADFDKVDLSNLQRQIAHTTVDIDRLKVESARDTVLALNDNTEVTLIPRRMEEPELRQAVSEADIVVDCCDNFATRYDINRVCFETRTPLVSGAAIQLEGQVIVFDPRDPDSACYRCLYQEAADERLNCAENGVAAPVVGIIGTVQAMETMKLIMGLGNPLVNHLLVFDARNMEWHKLRLPRNPDCEICGQR